MSLFEPREVYLRHELGDDALDVRRVEQATPDLPPAAPAGV
jgi:hypothetical protein